MWDPQVARQLVPELRTLFADEMNWDGRRWGREEQVFTQEAAGWTLGGAR